MLYRRQLKDALPSSPKYGRGLIALSYVDMSGKPSAVWGDIKKQRVDPCKNGLETVEHYHTNTCNLPSFSVGDSASIKNKSGSHLLHCDHILERLERRQYRVKCNGSGRTLHRYYTHLHKIPPNICNQSLDFDSTTPNPTTSHPRFSPTWHKGYWPYWYQRCSSWFTRVSW